MERVARDLGYASRQALQAMMRRTAGSEDAG